MTGYGRGEYENDLYRVKIEMKSLNHRYNDINIKLPRHILYLEEHIKKVITKYIYRGKIDVFINLEYISDSPLEVKVDLPLAKSYKLALDSLCKELVIDEDVSLDHLINIPDIITTERKGVDEEAILDCLDHALEMALENIVKMRESEGNILKQDILSKLANLDRYLDRIEKRAPRLVLEYEERLRERIEELLDVSNELDEDRLNNEIAYFIDKKGIDEEIVRLESHIKQLESILEEEGAIGRKLDFLIQEFNREINTIGSKSNDEEISKHVIEFKAELERIREQVQNIE